MTAHDFKDTACNFGHSDAELASTPQSDGTSSPAPRRYDERMTFRDTLAMLALSAAWGASFLFLHVAAPVVGPVAVAAIRVSSATILLLPLVLWRGDIGHLRTHAVPMLACGMLAFGLPFICLSLATRHLPAGLMSILNATTPMWGAFIGWVWLKERMHLMRSLGLVLGLAGVILLTLDKGTMPSSNKGLGAVLLMLCATLSYALAVNVARRHLHRLSPLTSATGTLCMTMLVMAGPALWLGPQPMPSIDVHAWRDVPAAVWAALLTLGMVCTGLAQIVFFQLIGRIGPNQALTVTFLIPVFGMLWGALFLHEHVTAWMLMSTAIIALGTWLANRPAVASPPKPTQV